MLIEIISFSSDNKDLFNSAVNIRFDVFSSELGISKDVEFDGFDFVSIHYLLFVDKFPVAACRWRETDEGIYIERLAVLKKFRSYGYGFLLLKHIIKEILISGKKIFITCQSDVTKFFELAGFIKDNSIPFETNNQNIKMIYKI